MTDGPGDPFDLEVAVTRAALDPGDLPAYGEVLAGLLDVDPLLAVRRDNAEVPMDTYRAGSNGPTSWR